MNVVDEVIEAYGGLQSVMDEFELQDSQAVYNWRRRGIPYSKVEKIHDDTGIPLAKLMAREATAA